MNGKLYHLPFDEANAHNNSFAEQCSAPSVDTTPCFSPNLDYLSFSLPEVTVEQVDIKNSIQSIYGKHLNKTINNRLLKLSRMYISAPLAHIFNISLKSGVFPSSWKIARIQPIYKQKGDRSSECSVPYQKYLNEWLSLVFWTSVIKRMSSLRSSMVFSVLD